MTKTSLKRSALYDPFSNRLIILKCKPVYMFLKVGFCLNERSIGTHLNMGCLGSRKRLSKVNGYFWSG